MGKKSKKKTAPKKDSNAAATIGTDGTNSQNATATPTAVSIPNGTSKTKTSQDKEFSNSLHQLKQDYISNFFTDTEIEQCLKVAECNVDVALMLLRSKAGDGSSYLCTEYSSRGTPHVHQLFQPRA